MGMLKVYTALVFGISVGLYFMGYSAPFLTFISQDFNYETFTNKMLDILQNQCFLGLLGMVAGATVVSSLIGGSGAGSGFISFAFPIFIIMSFANFFVLPMDFIFEATIPFELKMLVAGFLNLTLAMAIVEFVRGMA